MREWILPDIKHVHLHIVKMTGLTQLEKGWNIECGKQVFESQKVIVCTGSKPKGMNLPKVTVPLPMALSKTTLEQHVTKTDKVIVFGTAHSGTLILKNLYEIGCTDVVVVYKGKTPFCYARDGVLGGIKQESETIADEIVGNKWGALTPCMIEYEDFARVFRAVDKADIVIYSIGFEKTHIQYLDMSGSICEFQHNPEDGSFHTLKNIWGFGIAFPSYLVGSTHPDVGFLGFITAIQNALPSILRTSL
jgi:hypothetical protein